MADRPPRHRPGRAPLDRYPTPASATLALLEHAELKARAVGPYSQQTPLFDLEHSDG